MACGNCATVPWADRFVSLARVDTAAARVVVAEGWVYSLPTDKRDLLRQMEAALRTLR